MKHYDTITDFLIAQGYVVNNDKAAFVRAQAFVGGYAAREISFSALANHTVKSFAALAEKQGWVETTHAEALSSGQATVGFAPLRELLGSIGRITIKEWTDTRFTYAEEDIKNDPIVRADKLVSLLSELATEKEKLKRDLIALVGEVKAEEFLAVSEAELAQYLSKANQIQWRQDQLRIGASRKAVAVRALPEKTSPVFNLWSMNLMSAD